MPNRIIKESIRTSKTINQLTDFQFRMWIYLITYVDDYGRGSADPELIKGFVFPRRNRITESDIKKTLAELAGMGCINLYDVDGESFFYFPNWGEHQRIQTKKSKFPEPQPKNDTYRDSQNSTVVHGDPPPESNPIQSESNTKYESKSKSESESKGASAFDVFWKAYPKKIGKIAAKKAFDKVKIPVETLVQAIDQQKCSEQWRKNNGQYIPNPATWLNQGRWEDECCQTVETVRSRNASYDLSAFDDLALFGGGK